MRVVGWLLLVACLLGGTVPLVAAPQHGLALHGEPHYPPDFTHFAYANPDAPKGGAVRLAAVGTFDSLNPFILRGTPPSGIGMLFDTLMVSSADEAFSVYGLIAETVEVDPDNRHATFTLRREARFHDGQPITVDDVLFSLEVLQRDGHPFYRSYYGQIERAEALDARRVRFHFSDPDNRELPLIAGQLPVLPRHDWEARDFTRTTLEPPLGSGPYRIEAVDPGRSITYRRVEDYWAADLPVRRGMHNFDTIRYDFYRDATVALEAFKAGEYDFRQENIARQWAEGYAGPALSRGWIRMEEIPNSQSQGMQGFALNTRRPLFEDRRVRKALGLLFDYEWVNRTLFHGAYVRSYSYWSNSELAATGLPSAAELELLEPWRDRLPPELFEREFRPPVTDGSGHVRPQLVQALGLLREAGWEVRDNRLIHQESGRPFQFEILLLNPSFERVVLPYVRNLERLGIRARVRTVDSTQYQRRLDDFDFDLTVVVLPQSLSPGNEQFDLFGSAAAQTPGSRNYAGIDDPVVDALIERVVRAESREGLITATRALDRVLLWGHYVIPNWHTDVYRVAYWDKFGRPTVTPRYALGFESWWIDPERVAALRAAGATLRSIR